MTLYIRLGDADDIHEDDLDGLAESLWTLGVRTVRRGPPFGLYADGFLGNNYISTYFGPDIETPERGLTDDEIVRLNLLLQNMGD